MFGNEVIFPDFQALRTFQVMPARETFSHENTAVFR
jgi:hypothetical protein